jgi:hypothetical protein
MRSIGHRKSMRLEPALRRRTEGDRAVPTWATFDRAVVYLVFKTFSQKPSVG